MSADFSIEVDRAASVVRITMSGFFSTEDVKRFVRERSVVNGSLGRSPAGLSTIVDIRGMKIQPQEVVAAFAKVLDEGDVASRRIAFIVAAGLARAQIRRAADGRIASYFATEKEAEAWLTHPLEDGPCERSALGFLSVARPPR